MTPPMKCVENIHLLKIKKCYRQKFSLTRMVKIVLCGKQGTGKSALAVRFVHDYFDSNTPSTIGASFFSKDVYVDNKNVNLSIWDTAGSERYSTMMPMYMRNAKIVLLCFDEDRQEDLEVQVSKIVSANDSAKIILVATKTDIHSNYKLAEKFGIQNDLELFFTSSFSGDGISNLFDKTAKIAAESSTREENPPIKNIGAKTEHTCCYH